MLRLFTSERSEWNVDAAARELGLSQSTAYQYFRSLIDARLLVASKAGRYVIGPAIIEFDRHVRQLDPLIRRPADHGEAQRFPRMRGRGPALPHLWFHGHVRRPEVEDAADLRGELRAGPAHAAVPGAASKVILADLSLRTLRRHYEAASQEIAAAGLGADWTAFKATLRKIRAQGVCVTHAEIDPGMVGISAPVFGPNSEIMGSVGLVVSGQHVAKLDNGVDRLSQRVKQAGQDLTAALRNSE